MTEKQLKAIENAQRYFNSGFNCSESSALALTEYLEIKESDHSENRHRTCRRGWSVGNIALWDIYRNGHGHWNEVWER
jgi:hypothetical protein